MNWGLEFVQSKLKDARALIEYKPQVIFDEGNVAWRHKAPNINTFDEIAEADIVLQSVGERRDLTYPMKDCLFVQQLRSNDIPLPTNHDN